MVMTVVIAACDGGEAERTTTSVLITEPTEPAVTTPDTTAPGDEESTTSVLRGQAIESWEIVGRESADEGETLYIVIPPGAYTDVDLENFVLDLYEGEVATWGAEVFDDANAVDAYRVPEEDRTEAEQELVDGHHFVSLVEGSIIRFQGPFSSSGEYPIGS